MVTVNQAIERFGNNEELVNTFVNMLGSYFTNTTPPQEVETLPSLMQRLQNRYLNITSRGDWITGELYDMNDVVKQSGVAYLCVTGHVSGDFASDLASAKWIAYSALDSVLHNWTQSGAFAVPSNVSAKLLESLPSPEDFGATGGSDDTLALQRLFNAHKQVRLLPGKVYKASKLSISQDLEIFGYGSKLLHKANSAAQNSGLLEMLTDNKLVIHGLNIDGNGLNQTALVGYYNMLWCAIGSMELYNCVIGNTKGHAVRTGNIDNFDASKFAHDIIMAGCRVIQSRNANESGDCVRIERTRGVNNVFINNYVDGGLSGMRSQLYCKNLKFIGNEVCYAWIDVGITVQASEHLEIVNNYCHHNVNHGFEIDGVVNCRNVGNFAYKNGKSGFLVAESGAAIYIDEARYSGSIAEGYGTDYSNQTHSSPQVPNIDTIHANNISLRNSMPDRLIGLDTDIWINNLSAYNNPSPAADQAKGQLGIEGGTGLRSSSLILNNTFIPNSNDPYCIYIYQYQQNATVSGNKVIGNVKLMQLAALGMRDANDANKYLCDPSKRSVLLSDVNDSTAKMGHAVKGTTTGSQTYPFTGMWIGANNEKRLRIIAKVGSGTQTGYVAVNLYSGDTFVITLVSESAITLTTEYKAFDFRVPASASVGNNIRPQLRIPIAGVDVYISELNLYLND